VTKPSYQVKKPSNLQSCRAAKLPSCRSADELQSCRAAKLPSCRKAEPQYAKLPLTSSQFVSCRAAEYTKYLRIQSCRAAELRAAKLM
jgi:hypothetical protein